MGKAIVYCHRCSVILREDAFERGKAVRKGDLSACAPCAKELGIPIPPPARTQDPSSAALRRVQAKPSMSTPKLPIPPVPGETAEAEAPPDRRKKILLIAGSAAGGIVAAVALVLLLVGRSKPPPATAAATPPEAAAAAAPLSPPPAGPMKPEEVALETAHEFAKDHPEDVAGQVREYDKVRWEFDGTPAAKEAAKVLEELKGRLRGRLETDLAALEKEIEGPLSREEFGAVLGTIEEARNRLESQDWKLALDRRIREIRDRARVLFAEVGKKVAQAPEERAKALQRVRGWGIESYVADFEESFPAVADAARPAEAAPPKPKGPPIPVETRPRSEEGKAWLARWEQAMAKAAARDYAAALGEIGRAAGALREDETRAEAEQDAKDLKALEALLAGTVDAFLKKPRPGLSLETVGGGKVSGRVVQVDGDRVELLGDPRKASSFVEWVEVRAVSMAPLMRGQRPEPRILAIYLLLDGEIEPAKAELGEKLDGVPPKYWAWAPGAREKAARPDRVEAAARELYYLAEREYRALETRAQAAAKYTSLKNDYAVASVVRKNLERILRRSTAGEEYYLAVADLHWEGTFGLRKDGRLETREDTAPHLANHNGVEFQFGVLPGKTYRCWVLAGGCCLEAFTFLWQATELGGTHPRTGKKISLDPGGPYADTVRPFVRNAKALHSQHAARGEKKSASRWEWVELPLPKYAGPGVKRVRLMTEQRGFGIAAVFVSCGPARKAPPSESEIKELEKARGADAISLPVDADLVGHWGLDEGEGTAVEDLSGNGRGGKLAKAAAWSAGKVDGALVFNGKDTAVTVADAEELRITGDMTVAFWVRKKASGGDWQRLVGKGDEKIRNYGVWTGGGEGGGNKVLFQQYDAGAQTVLQLFSEKSLKPGQWHHVAAVLEGDRATIYLDGAKDAAGTRTGTPGTSNAPLTIGYASLHAWFAGSMDDVRLYRRALSADEVAGLFGLGR